MNETNNNGKFYWLKLKRDFFKRHDITILESMPNGKEYSLFYLKLMLESIDHEGMLRFSEQIPYNEQMLAAITNTNVDTVRSAIKVLEQLKLLEILDDATIYMTEVENMIGSETKWAEKKRLYRENTNKIGQCPLPVLPMSDKSKSIEKDIELDKELELDINTKEDDKEKCQPTSGFTSAPGKISKHKYGSFKNVLLTEEEYNKLKAMENGEKAIEFLSNYREYKGYKAKSDYLAIRKWVFDALKEEEQKKARMSGNYSKPNKFTAGDRTYEQMMLDEDVARAGGFIADEDLDKVEV